MRWTSSHSSDDIIRHIIRLSGEAASTGPESLEDLRTATAELVLRFKAEGRLDHSPMKLAMTRTVELRRARAEAKLRGRRVLVTGGLGCVGSRLVPLLRELGAARIAIVDHAESAPAVPDVRVHRVDIRDASALDRAFAEAEPDVVFHLASIREPGRAEAIVREAIETNVFGTGNVIEVCRAHGVADAIYSSTGKCFAYVTDHVYAGSKKLAEAQWVAAARESRATRFRFTRFTHILENGVVTQDIARGVENGLVTLHGPDRNFNIQNLSQATHLLVNALALSDDTPPDGFWCALDLGWPVNTLELALFEIERRRARAAIVFKGVPNGYDEAFFRGQFSWNGIDEYHPLINALEVATSREDDSGTMKLARVAAFDPALLSTELEKLRRTLATEAEDAVGAKETLLEAVSGFAAATFASGDPERLIDILWWGAAPEWAGEDGANVRRFKRVVRLLTNAVAARLEQMDSPVSAEAIGKLREVERSLSGVGELAVATVRLRSAIERRL